MSLDVLFPEDIKQILLAAERASTASLAEAAGSVADLATLRAYNRGYQAALSAVALACGLGPILDTAGSAPGRRCRRELEWT